MYEVGTPPTHNLDKPHVLLDSITHTHILSATALAKSMKGDEGTWGLTKRKYSIFTWDFGE